MNIYLRKYARKFSLIREKNIYLHTLYSVISKKVMNTLLFYVIKLLKPRYTYVKIFKNKI